MADSSTPDTSPDNAEDNNKPGKTNRGGKFLAWFGQAIVPVLLGSFLFSGILEGYKSSLGDKKDIIDSYYRPMRALHASCSSKHLELADQYGKLAGSYQLQFDELKHILTHPELASKPGYDAVPRALYKTNEELAKSSKELSTAVRQCRTDLYIKYEELALVTGTYEKFKRLASVRDKSIEQIDKQMKLSMEPYLEASNSNDMMALLRKVASSDAESSADQQKMLEEVSVYAKPVVELNLLFRTTEQNNFNAEQSFFKSTRNLFAREISARQSKGFFSYLF